MASSTFNNAGGDNALAQDSEGCNNPGDGNTEDMEHRNSKDDNTLAHDLP